jgi:hypothetical protein
MRTVSRFFKPYIIVLAALLLINPQMAFVQEKQGIGEPFAAYYWHYHGERVLGRVNSPLLEVDGCRVQYFEKGRLDDCSSAPDTASEGGEQSTPIWEVVRPGNGHRPGEQVAHSPLLWGLIRHMPEMPIDGLPLSYGDLYGFMEHIPPPAGFEAGTSTMTPAGVFVPNHPNLEVEPGFLVPPYFWNFINQAYLFPNGWLRDTGLPLTRAFPVEIGGSTQSPTRTVVVQAFERTLLTYDPSEPLAWPVQRANIGTDALRARGGTPFFQQPDPPPYTAQARTGPKRIEVSLARQWLYAYEGNRLIFDMPISTGKDGFETPPGSFAIRSKIRQKTLRGAMGGERWNIPDVPFIMFYDGDIAIHGVYWHYRFGTGERHSHGCIGLWPADAALLYAWAERGMPVIVY